MLSLGVYRLDCVPSNCINLRKDDGICQMSLCLISDDLNYDVLFVYDVQRRANSLIHEKISSVNAADFLQMEVEYSTRTLKVWLEFVITSKILL